MVAYVSGNGLRPGYVIKYNNQLYRVMSAEHRTPGNKRAFCQAKLRSLRDGNQTEVKFRADEEVERAALEQAEMEYLYEDPAGYCFMNLETYDQVFVEGDLLKDAIKFMLPNTKVQMEFYEEKAIGVSLPETVELKITETDPPYERGDGVRFWQACNAGDGFVVNVPQFIETGEVIRVSTASGDYQERVKN